MREEELGVAARAEIHALDVANACAVERARSDGPEIEDAVLRQVGVEPCRHFRSDLVAARTDGGPDDRSRGDVAERAYTRLHDALGEAAPPCMEDGQPRLAAGRGDRDRYAVGGEREHRLSRNVAPESISRLVADPGLGPVHRRRVALAVDGQPRGIEAERGAGATPVLDHTRGIVAAGAQVERRVRAFADPADARR